MLINVPDFTATIERTLFFELPYKLNAAYFNVRVTPVSATFVKRNFGALDFCFTRLTATRSVRFTNFETAELGGKSRAVFEWALTFGEVITNVEVGFPLESYNTTRSNWADTEASPFPNVVPFAPGSAPAELTSFSWPPTSLLTSLFTSLTSTGQVGRNPSAKLFQVQDYVLVYQPRV
eukprot:TRINITY_DN5896_c0_g1_i1.p2 TRINITY_DN5896_c0_g1~~TRINITY_DN5896_c0_g1_i1.p2  ORF type:complete len:178 (-),score=38.36 TRINITY_DN5896_c0_g1_i1:48-581(-)